MRRVALLLAAAAFAAAVGLGVRAAFLGGGRFRPPADPARPKVYSRVLAEGVRYRDLETLGVDRFAFRQCRVEKRRSGALTFGAFNVLVVDELVLNLAPATTPPAPAAADAVSARRVADSFAETFLHSQGLGAGRFSGVCVNGLTVNRVLSNRTERVFTAARAESAVGQAGLRLRQCMVYAPDGTPQRVDKARLLLQPTRKLVYTQSGIERSVDLTDSGFPNK